MRNAMNSFFSLGTCFMKISLIHAFYLPNHYFTKTIFTSRLFESMDSLELSSLITSDFHLPELIVFDLDQCLWHPEMYTLYDIPSPSSKKCFKSIDESDQRQIITAIASSDEYIRLFPAALKVLQDYYMNNYPNMRIAVASSADTPLAVQIGRAAMNILEIFPGVTVRQAFAKGWPDGFEGNLQIGRTHPLTPDKSRSHFPILQKNTGIEYGKMLFFDDCLWGDHCQVVYMNASTVYMFFELIEC